jgi:hypothetical protein
MKDSPFSRLLIGSTEVSRLFDIGCATMAWKPFVDAVHARPAIQNGPIWSAAVTA